MMRILITGANSYIGTYFRYYISQWPDAYQVETIDMRDESWRNIDFSGYDVVFHVAGIAHQDSGRIQDSMKALYYKVNTELAIETAGKAKRDGVKQFIFMSSIIIYGLSAKMGETKVITHDTLPAPIGVYGHSKLFAEKGIEPLNDDSFRVCILRSPMIYGPGCKGNYRLLSKVARIFPLFPNIQNQRSMLFVGNLCAYLKTVVDNYQSGILYPQNMEYVCTSEMVCKIASIHGKTIRLTYIFNPLIHLLSVPLGVLNKIFGSLVYEKSSEFPVGMVSFSDSIALTEE